jgi:hypothetical protein
MGRGDEKPVSHAKAFIRCGGDTVESAFVQRIDEFMALLPYLPYPGENVFHPAD